MLEAIKDVWPMALLGAVAYGYILYCRWCEKQARIASARRIERELKDNAVRQANAEAIRNSYVMAERNDAEWAKAHGNTR